MDSDKPDSWIKYLGKEKENILSIIRSSVLFKTDIDSIAEIIKLYPLCKRLHEIDKDLENEGIENELY